MNKKIPLVSVILAVAIIMAVYLVVNPCLGLGHCSINGLPASNSPPSEEDRVNSENCFVREVHEVIGHSLTGLIEEGETVTVLSGYYDCHTIERNDIVAYNFAGNEYPIIKIVKALPGDRFSLKEAEGGLGWNIIVNSEIVANSNGEPYLLNEARHRMLSLYEEDYNATVPENSYLILSNLISGGIDSSVFGLVHKNDILGKAEKLAK